MWKSNLTKTQQAIILGGFMLGTVIALVEMATSNFFLPPMWLFILLFALCTFHQIFEQKQPLTTQQKSLLLFWTAWTGFILLMGQDAFIAVLAIPVFQMKHLREKLEKESPAQ